VRLKEYEKFFRENKGTKLYTCERDYKSPNALIIYGKKELIAKVSHEINLQYM